MVQTRARANLARANDELRQTNEDLVVARGAAEANEALALEKEAEALWQSYAANVVAANASLDLGATRDAIERLEACPEAHRNWEWHYLRNRADSSLASIQGSPESFILSVAYDPRGRYFASASGNDGDTGGSDFTVRIWDAQTGAPVRTLEGHRQRVVSLAFSPSGTELASGSFDGTVRVWDVASGEPVAMRPRHRQQGRLSPRRAAHRDRGRVRPPRAVEHPRGHGLLPRHQIPRACAACGSRPTDGRSSPGCTTTTCAPGTSTGGRSRTTST